MVAQNGHVLMASVAYQVQVKCCEAAHKTEVEKVTFSCKSLHDSCQTTVVFLTPVKRHEASEILLQTGHHEKHQRLEANEVDRGVAVVGRQMVEQISADIQRMEVVVAAAAVA